MADEIKKQTGIAVQLIEGSGGVFEVKADGKLIFSKAAAGRFPETAEVLSQLQ